MHLTLLWSLLEAFWRYFWVIFAESSRIFVLHTGCVLKIIESIFLSVFSVFLFYVAVCDVTWSAELPEGSSFMF